MSERPKIPEISVLVVAYNCAEALPQFFSALGGEHSRCPFELIFVNDASTDQTGAIAHDAVKKIGGIYLDTVKRQGLAIARNTAVRASRGQALLFLDSLTTLHPHVVAAHATMHRERQFSPLVVAGKVLGIRETGPQLFGVDKITVPLTELFSKGIVTSKTKDGCLSGANFSAGRKLFIEGATWFDDSLSTIQEQEHAWLAYVLKLGVPLEFSADPVVACFGEKESFTRQTPQAMQPRSQGVALC